MTIIKPISLLFIPLIICMLSCNQPSENTQNINPENLGDLEKNEETTDFKADTLDLILDMVNTGISHGWGYVYKATVKMVVNGKKETKEINPLEISVDCEKEWGDILPDSSGLPVEIAIRFLNQPGIHKFNPGICGFIDSTGAAWKIETMKGKLTDEERIKIFKSIYKKEYTITEEKTESVVFDRLKYSWIQQLTFKKNSQVNYGDGIMVTPKFNFWYICYDSRDKLEDAINLMLRTFAEDIGNNARLEIGQNAERVKSPPIFAVINENEIILIKYPCEHLENDWFSIKKNIVTHFAKKGFLTFDIDCGGPLVWNSEKYLAQ